MARLVLIDGNAILHRAYHALPPLTSRDGRVVNAVYGFFGMLFRVVEDLKPTHLAIAFDTEKPTFRHAAYVGYQSHRPRLESDLAEQIGLTQEILTAGGIPVFIAPGYEADDIIGTLANKSAGPAAPHPRSTSSRSAAGAQRGTPAPRHPQNIEVVIVTGDRDLLQLVTKNVKVCFPVHGLTETQLFGEREVKNYMGVMPAQIVDYKALIGDQSDNYPGVAGIGPKTAVGLLEKFKTFDGVYKNLKKVSSNVMTKLSEGHDSGVLSRDLATIRRDVPVTFDLEKMEFIDFHNNPSLSSAFAELGFKSLTARTSGKPVERNTKPKKTKEQMELI